MQNPSPSCRKCLPVPTKEVELGRQRQGVSIGDKGVVALILWSHIVNDQLVEPVE